MKWGIRRYQDENGRLTEEGLIRYSNYHNIKKDKVKFHKLHPEDAKKIKAYLDKEIEWNKSLDALEGPKEKKDSKSGESFISKTLQNIIDKQINIWSSGEASETAAEGKAKGEALGKYLGDEAVEALKKEKEKKEASSAKRKEIWDKVWDKSKSAAKSAAKSVDDKVKNKRKKDDDDPYEYSIDLGDNDYGYGETPEEKKRRLYYDEDYWFYD